MRGAFLLVAVAAACGEPSFDRDGGDAAPDASPVDGALGHPDDAGGTVDAPVPAPGDAGPLSARILYQCTAFAGGICVMGDDGSGQQRLHDAGFAPRGLDDGSVLFHTAGYRIARRQATGTIDDLGPGAFARRRPVGDLVFQCSGLAGGLCTMDPGGQRRRTLRATGRVPDVDGSGALLFHTDAYRVVRRDPDGTEHDLGAGAFATWRASGGIVFQCSGLDGGLCAMDRDGSGRAPIDAAGRVPHASTSGTLVFHTDGYRVAVLAADGEPDELADGANAVWW